MLCGIGKEGTPAAPGPDAETGSVSDRSTPAPAAAASDSVASALRQRLLELFRLTDPAALQLRPELQSALESLGASEDVESALRQMRKVWRSSGGGSRRVSLYGTPSWWHS